MAIKELMERQDVTLRMYFEDIADSTPLSREREQELSTLIKAGDHDARQELVEANLRFVIDVAKGYQNRGLDMGELISLGNMGLLIASERFDGDKGYKFISYAVWWIKQSILQGIADHGRTVRLPLNKLSLLNDISKAAKRLGQGRESEPQVEEIADELDMPADEILDAMLSGRPARSLDDSFDEGDDRTLLSVLSDSKQDGPDTALFKRDVTDEVATALKCLDDRERYILRLYFGLDDNEPMTLEEIGSVMGLTRERVRQLKERAFLKLRHPETGGALRSLIEEVGVH